MNSFIVSLMNSSEPYLRQPVSTVGKYVTPPVIPNRAVPSGSCSSSSQGMWSFLQHSASARSGCFSDHSSCPYDLYWTVFPGISDSTSQKPDLQSKSAAG